MLSCLVGALVCFINELIDWRWRCVLDKSISELLVASSSGNVEVKVVIVQILLWLWGCAVFGELPRAALEMDHTSCKF